MVRMVRDSREPRWLDDEPFRFQPSAGEEDARWIGLKFAVMVIHRLFFSRNTDRPELARLHWLTSLIQWVIRF